ncbi:MAG: hypothetical protein ABFD83_13510 [Armatimonadota bacterium]
MSSFVNVRTSCFGLFAAIAWLYVIILQGNNCDPIYLLLNGAIMTERIEWRTLSKEEQLCKMRSIIEQRHGSVTDKQWNCLVKYLEDFQCDYATVENRKYFIKGAEPFFAFAAESQPGSRQQYVTVPHKGRCTHKESLKRLLDFRDHIDLMQCGSEGFRGYRATWQEIAELLNEKYSIFPWIPRPVKEAYLKVLYSRSKKKYAERETVADRARQEYVSLYGREPFELFRKSCSSFNMHIIGGGTLETWVVDELRTRRATLAYEEKKND